MIPTSATPSEPVGSELPAPPGTPPTVAPDDEHPSAGRATGRSARWALGGLAVAGLAYVAVVDPNEPNLVPSCAFKALTGLDCPGCGGTRAVHALLHGDVASALNHNVLVVATIAVAVVWLVWNRLAPRLGREPKRFSLSPPWAIALFIGVGAFWLLRNVPIAPFSWLGSGS